MPVDILLANSYYLSFDPTEQQIMRPYPPLGPLYVAAYLRREGFRVAAFDCTFAQDEQEFARALREHDPPVVGIHATILTRPWAGRMIAIAKAQGRTVMVGGPDPASYVEEYLRDHGADYVVVGEGEETARELLAALLGETETRPSTIPGLAFRDGERIVYTPPREKLKDLDRLPRPALDLVDVPRYLRAWKERHGYTSLHLITNRGCPFTCAWCSRAVYGRSYRQRSPENVAEEMRYLKETYQPDRLWIADDVVGIDRRWITRWRDALVARDAVIPFEGICRVDLINETVLRDLKEAGCRRIYYGAESGSQKVLDAMRKGFTVEEIYRACRLTRSAGIEIGLFTMFGYPGETAEDVRRTIRLVKEICPEFAGFSVAFPLKGTEFYELVKDELPAHLHWTATHEKAAAWKTLYPSEYYQATIRYLTKLLAVHRASVWSPSRISNRAKMAYYWLAMHRHARPRPDADAARGPQLNVFSQTG
jgi:radical SAM superfamily enzyme YgiQ (UPF0313 family)